MIEQAAKRSRELFASAGYYCAESVLLAIAEQQGIQSDVIPRIATGFCSGMADTCGLCGAVSGAMMGIGLLNGVRTPGDDRAANYAAVRKLLAQFEAKFGSTNCRVLTGCDLGTPEGQAQFRASGQGERCTSYVEEATRLALSVVESGSQPGAGG
jgi:C_GCAxxG_C_C family probable redox protein